MTASEYTDAIKVAEARAAFWHSEGSAAMYGVWRDRAMELAKARAKARKQAWRASK